MDMKVTLENIQTEVDFSDLEVGDTFTQGGGVFIVIENMVCPEDVVGGMYNAFCFNDADFYSFSDTDKVLPVTVEIKAKIK